MADDVKNLNFKSLLHGTPEKAEPVEDDPGPCAARAKDRWVTALTVMHAAKGWESFQYDGIGTRSTFTPDKFEVVFIGHTQRWRMTVTGRNLWTIYNLIVQRRLEWIKAADRDFAGNKETIVLTVEVVEVPS